MDDNSKPNWIRAHTPDHSITVKFDLNAASEALQRELSRIPYKRVTTSTRQEADVAGPQSHL